MRLQSGDCYVLWSEQIVRLRERLDETRWMAVIWDRLSREWSPSYYAIDEHLIDDVVNDPQSVASRNIG